MPFQRDVIERMLLSKSLLGPIRFPPTARPDSLILARHILAAHDAAELALAGIAQHLGKPPDAQQVHLMDYFPAIKKMHPEKDVEGKEYFNQLNRVRIHIKHHGLFPDQKQWYRVGEKTYDYVYRWCENYFNVSLDDLDESSLIHDSEVKSKFDLAKQYFELGDYQSTLENIGLAIHILFFNNVSLKNLHAGVSRAEDAIRLSAFGVNANDYLTLQEFLPKVKEEQEGSRVVAWEQEKFGHPGNWHRESADFCLRTFLSIAICIQNAEWIPSAINFRLVYEYKITALRDGVEIFIGKAGTLIVPDENEREVIRTLNEGESIQGSVARKIYNPVTSIDGKPDEDLLTILPVDGPLSSGFVRSKEVRVTCVPAKHPFVTQYFPELPEFELKVD